MHRDGRNHLIGRMDGEVNGIGSDDGTALSKKRLCLAFFLHGDHFLLETEGNEILMLGFHD